MSGLKAVDHPITRELKQTTEATAMKMPQNKMFNEQNNGLACAAL